MPRLVKSGKKPPPPGWGIVWKKRVNQPFENVFLRTPPILGVLDPENMLLEFKELLLGTF